MSDRTDLTALLRELAEGDPEAMDRLLPAVYQDLRRIARKRLAGEGPDHTLSTTEVVHEAYLRLADLDRLQWKNRAQFFAVAARLMRRILVDHAVRQNALKRGGEARHVALAEVESVLSGGSSVDAELLDLDDALTRLADLEERQARVVEYRFFAGMSVEETAEALEISPATVKRDWTAARAWLHRELAR